MKQLKLYLLLALLAATLPATAYDFVVDGLCYNFNSDGTSVSVTYENSNSNYPSYSNLSGELNIPASVTYDGATYSVTAIGTGALRRCSELTSITISNSVTSIGIEAFSHCSGLTSVSIPNSVTIINKMAFAYCDGLTSVIIGNSVTTIGQDAFYQCTGINDLTYNAINCTTYTMSKSNIKQVTIGNQVETLPAQFVSSSRITSVKIPSSVTSIGERAFWNCESLTSVTWNAKNCSDLSNNDCFWNTGIKTFIFGDEVETIPAYICSDLSGLTSVTIPNSVTTIGNNAFYGCRGLTSVPIGNSVTSIGNNAFYGCSGLTSVTIPNSVTTIGHDAFYDCSGLTNLTLGNSVTTIGVETFRGCSSLTKVTIPNSVTSIGSNAFSYCSGLRSLVWNAINCASNGSMPTSGIESVSIGNQVETLPANFIKGSQITTITIPNSVTSIGSKAFDGCTSLVSLTWNAVNCNSNGSMPTNNIEHVKIGNNVETLPANFVSGSKITTVTIPTSVTTIGDYAFSSCAGLSNLTIPNSVTSIGNYAFEVCTGLTSLTIPNSVTFIGGCAFTHCENITNINIPNSLTSISNGLLSWCQGLTSITIPNSITNIGNLAFYGCDKLALINIPNSVNSIGSQAFDGCTSLKNVTIGNSITDIGYDAFNNCTSFTDLTWNAINCTDNSNMLKSNIERVTIGNQVETLPANFLNGSKISSVNIPNSVTSIGNNAFKVCGDLKKAVIPNSVSTVGASAFEGCNGLNVVVIGENVAVIGEKAFAAPALTDIVAMRTRPVAIPENTFEGVSLPGVDLHVRSGSKARYEMQAVWQDFPFIVEDAENYTSELPDDPGSGIRGDVNGDGQVNTGDVSTIYQIILGQ